MNVCLSFGMILGYTVSNWVKWRFSYSLCRDREGKILLKQKKPKKKTMSLDVFLSFLAIR